MYDVSTKQMWKIALQETGFSSLQSLSSQGKNNYCYKSFLSRYLDNLKNKKSIPTSISPSSKSQIHTSILLVSDLKTL